jgi:hypothetical protein
MATVQVTMNGNQPLRVRDYCAPCDLFFVYDHATCTIKVEYGHEHWMYEEQAAAAKARQLFLVFDSGRAPAKRKSETAALQLVNQ